MSSDVLSGDRFDGVRDYDWFRERRRQIHGPIAGTQISVTPDSSNASICGRLLDSSVLVGGFGGLPIVAGGVGIAALGGTAYPAPTWSGNVTLTPSATALSTDVVVQATFNNIPQDGNFNDLLWVFRRTGQGTWSPWAETPANGLPNPPASQTLSFGFGNLVSGLSYDFGVAYVTANGAYGAIAVLASNYAVPVVAIPSSYMLGGTAINPAFSGVTTAIGSSVNGISTPLTANWTCTNQPTDGSLSRVSLWIRQNGTTNWTYYASLQAVGVNQTSPPASGAYTFTFTDLTNGITYDLGLSYENAQGGESNVVAFASSIAMPAVGPPATAKMPSALLTSGPHISSDTIGSFNNAGTANPSLPIGVTFTDWTSGTLPAWLLGVRFYIRIHGTTNPQPMGDQTTSGSTTMNVTLALGAGTTIDIGCSYLDNAGEESAIAWPSGAWNAVAVPAIGPNGIYSLGGPNLVPDSQFAYANFNTSGVGSNDPYWNFYLIDGTSFFVGRGSGNGNYLGVRPGDSAKLCKAQSEVITAQPNTLYTVSAYIDASTCSGANLPYIAIVSTDQATEYVRASQTIGQKGTVSAQYTTPASGGPTQFTVMFNSNNTTISSSILVFAEPMLQVGQLGPYTPGPSVSGGVPSGTGNNPPPSSGSSGGGAADPGSGTGDGGGYHKHNTMSWQTRGVVTDTADSNNSHLTHGTVFDAHIGGVKLDTINDGTTYARIKATALSSGIVNLPTGVTGRLAQANHDATIVLAATGQQKNLAPDSDLKFGNAYWKANTGTIGIVAGAGKSGANGFVYTGNGAAAPDLSMRSLPIAVAAGLQYTLSAYINASQVTAVSYLGWGVHNWSSGSDGGVIGSTINVAPGFNGITGQTVTIPAGVTKVALVAYINGSTVTNGQPVVWSNPQLEAGATATGYKPNTFDDVTGGFSSSSLMAAEIPNSTAYRQNAHIWVSFPVGSTSLTYYIDDGGGAGAAPTFWRPDGTSFASAGIGVWNSKTGGVTVTGLTANANAYLCAYYVPGDTTGVNGTGWHVSVQATPFGINSTPIAQAYADGGYIAVQASTGSSATISSGTSGAVSTGGGGGGRMTN